MLLIHIHVMVQGTKSVLVQSCLSLYSLKWTQILFEIGQPWFCQSYDLMNKPHFTSTSVTSHFFLRLRPLRSADRRGVDRREDVYACNANTEQALLSRDVTTKVAVKWSLEHWIQNSSWFRFHHRNVHINDFYFFHCKTNRIGPNTILSFNLIL